MSIRRYTVTRIDADYYTVSEEELTVRFKPVITYDDTGAMIITYQQYTKWDFVSSAGGRWVDRDIPEQAQRRNSCKTLYKNDDSYTFYACVYHFPDPRLMGKWADYTSAYGWE